MALSRLEQLKEKFKRDEEEKKSKGKSKESYYPFWQMDFDKQSQVRFLLDENQDNPNLYYIEKKEHTLSINGEDKKFPCLSMYGEECPICSLAAKFYSASKKFPKDSPEQKANQKKGKYYYRDRRYLMQAVVKSDPLPPSDDPDNRRLNNIKIFQIGNELFQIIDSQIKRIIVEDSEDPFDLESGYDFTIQKTKKRVDGKDMASYASSSFARKSSELNLSDKKPFDLSKFLPEKPTLDVLENALNSHLNGVDEESDNAEETGVEKSSDSTTPNESIQKRLAELRRTTTSKPEELEEKESISDIKNNVVDEIENQDIELRQSESTSAPEKLTKDNTSDEDNSEDAEIEKLLTELKKRKSAKK